MVYFMKYEWRKQGKALYGARTAPALKTVPAQNYIKIDGRGDPNGADFSNRVEPCRRKTILRCPVEPVSPGSMEK